MSQLAMLKHLLSFFMDFAGFLIIWWIFSQYISSPGFGSYFVFFIMLLVIFNLSGWIADRIIRQI
jgi:hypothetical protein